MNKIILKADVIGVIRRAKNQSFPFQTALMELIDNSIDAGATEVSIREDEGDLVVQDNGHGIEDIEQALVIGSSSKDGKIGRYGVGMKDCCIRYSESTTVSSRGVIVSVPWCEIIDQCDPDRVFSLTSQDEPGTTITLEGFRRCYKSEILTSEISRTYRYLLESGGLSISINGKNLQPMVFPDFTDTIESDFHFCGRKASIYGGIFRQNDPLRKQWAGYNTFYRGRLIGVGKEMRYGVGDECCTNFAFFIQLHDDEGPWTLSTNKDDYEGHNELLDYCYEAFTREMMVKAAREAEDLDLKEVEQAISDSLSKSGNQTRKPPHNNTGTVTPKDTGNRKKNTFTATREGRYDAGDKPSRECRHKKVRFIYVNLGSDVVGEVNLHGKDGVIIKANEANKFIMKNKKSREMMEVIARLIYATLLATKEKDLFSVELTNSMMKLAGPELEFGMEEA
jgi:hypothetical protein